MNAFMVKTPGLELVNDDSDFPRPYGAVVRDIAF